MKGQPMQFLEETTVSTRGGEETIAPDGSVRPNTGQMKIKYLVKLKATGENARLNRQNLKLMGSAPEIRKTKGKKVAKTELAIAAAKVNTDTKHDMKAWNLRVYGYPVGKKVRIRRIRHMPELSLNIVCYKTYG